MAIIWVRDDVVLAIHRRQIAEHGGIEGVRDNGLLESALRKPQNLYYYEKPKPDIASLAASYAYGIIKNHPFIDGNKRTAFVVSMLFLRINDIILIASGEDKYKMFIELAAGNLIEEHLAEWIRSHVE